MEMPDTILQIDAERLKLRNGAVITDISGKPDKRRPVIRQYPRFIASMPLEWIATACRLGGKAVHVALAIWA